MALLHSWPLCHLFTTAPPTTHHNNSSMLTSKTGLHFTTKKLSSSSSLSVRCLKDDKVLVTQALDPHYVIVDPLPVDHHHDNNDLSDLGLSFTNMPKPDFRRKDFPRDFIFGASSSAMQTEGYATEGGRGAGIWDKTLEGKNAVQSYQLYKEDVKVLKDMGMNAYRFSIAWPRILPNGTIKEGINKKGIDFYNKLIDELLANGIQPIVTLLHFDVPQALHDKYKSFLDPQFIEDFKEYADLCFKTFGDRVKMWGTINEPLIFVFFGKQMGFPPELQTDPFATYIAYHHIILAHSAVAKHYQNNYKVSQRGKIGISLPIQWSMPYNPKDPTDLAANEAISDLQIGWFMNPLVYGDYPEWMKKNVKGLPMFSKKDKEMVKGAFDYIGLNYYTSRYFQSDFKFEKLGGKITITYEAHTKDVNWKQLGVQAKGRDDIYDFPEGLKQLLLHMKNKYGNPELYITENGTSTMPNVTDSITNLKNQWKRQQVEDALCDDTRIHYVMGHLKASLSALGEGVNLKGYVAWALMDNMEMGRDNPYDVRFGLNFVDYHDNHKRIPKKSAMWFRNFLK